MNEKIEKSIAFLKHEGIDAVSTGIVLGTGLYDLISQMEIKKSIDYSDIPHFPRATQEFHKGMLHYGNLHGKSLLVFQGRFHLYEGYDFFEITYLVLVFRALGGGTLILSNAAGAINLSFKKGALMLINDHINLQGGSPLAIKNIETLGDRFVDMSQPYDASYREKVIQIAKQNEVTLYQGVYVAVVGSQLETPAEYRYLKIIGADAVGMSTVPEVIVARQLGIRVLAISVLTDECNPDALAPIDIPEIMKMAKKGEKDFIKIVKAFVVSL